MRKLKNGEISYLELANRRVVIIGGGVVATRKVETLLKTGARLIVVAERIDDTLKNLCKGTSVELIESKYSKQYLAGATMAITATDNNKLNEQVYKDCQELEILCNVVDSPALCDFYVPAVIHRGDLQIAVGTDGKSPAFAGHIRKKLEKIFTEKHGQFLAEIERLREQVIKNIPDESQRKAIFGEIVDDASFEFFAVNGADAWQKKTAEMIKSHMVKI